MKMEGKSKKFESKKSMDTLWLDGSGREERPCHGQGCVSFEDK